MAKNDNLNLILPGIVLDLGKVIADASTRYSSGSSGVSGSSGSSGALNTEQIAAAEERILAKIKLNPAVCQLIGIEDGKKADTQDNNIRLRIFAFLAHKSLREQLRSPIDVAEVAMAAMDHRQSPGESILRARHVVGQMAASELLIASGNEGEGQIILNKVRLAAAALEWLTGGKNSMGVLTVPKLLGATGLQSDAKSANSSKSDKSAKSAVPLRIPTPRELYQRIRQRIIGLDSQVEAIACRLVMHMTRSKLIREGADPGTPNECWMVIGPPGVGKTYMLEIAFNAASELSGGFIPFATADGSDLTADGYVGLAFSDTLRHLLVAAKWDAERFRYGFLAVDEFTKKARSLGESSVTTVLVQQEALRVISGQTMSIGGRRGWDRPVPVTTVGTGFALMGHCPGLDRIIEKRLGKRHMGFSMGNGGEDRRSKSWLMDSLLDFGLIEELLSRQTAFIIVTPPSLDTLITSVTSNCGILESYNRLLARHNAAIFLEPSGVMALAQHGLENGYFRGIKRVISSLASEILFEERKGQIHIGAIDLRKAIAKSEGGMIGAAPLEEDKGAMEDISGGVLIGM
jgi:ATP-dependent Clp protease ATP-binding subunit ClpX